MCVGSFILDRESYMLRWPGEQRLTRKEGDVLKLLMQREGRTTERDLIGRLVWVNPGISSGEAWTSTSPGSEKSEGRPQCAWKPCTAWASDWRARSDTGDHSQRLPK